MNIPTNEDERPVSPIWLTSRSTRRSPGNKRPFEQAFCGVLVVLILAVALILSIVAVIIVSHR